MFRCWTCTFQSSTLQYLMHNSHHNHSMVWTNAYIRSEQNLYLTKYILNSPVKFVSLTNLTKHILKGACDNTELTINIYRTGLFVFFFDIIIENLTSNNNVVILLDHRHGECACTVKCTGTWHHCSCCSFGIKYLLLIPSNPDPSEPTLRFTYITCTGEGNTLSFLNPAVGLNIVRYLVLLGYLWILKSYTYYVNI